MNYRSFILCAVCVVTFFTFSSTIFCQLATSTFDTSADGWSEADMFFTSSVTNPPAFTNTHAVNYSSSSGNPGGAINYSISNGSTIFYFSAPAKFLGDKSTAYGKNLTFDIKNTFPASASNGHELIISGGGLTAFRSMNLPFTGSYYHFAISLNEGVWTLSNGIAATAANFKTILGSLTGIYIFGGGNGPANTSLDNVKVAPEIIQLNVQVTLSGYIGADFPIGQMPAQAKFDGGAAQYFAMTGNGNSAAFSMIIPSAGTTHNLQLKIPGYLSQTINFSITGGPITLNFNGTSGLGLSPGDTNADGVVDDTDLLAVINNFLGIDG